MAKKVIKDKKGSKATVAKPIKKSTASAKKVDTKKTAKTAKVSSSAKSKAPVSKKSTAKTVAPAKKATAAKPKAAAKKVATNPVVKAKVATKKAAVSKPTPAKTASKSVAKVAVVKAKVTATKNTTVKSVAKKAVPAKPIAKKEVVVVKSKIKAKVVKPIVEKMVVKPQPASVKKAKETASNQGASKSIPPAVLVEKVATQAVKAKRGRKKKRDDDDDDDDIVVPPPPPKREKSTLPKRNPSKSAGDELTLEGPAPKKISPIDLTSDQRLKLKKTLLAKSIEIVKNNISLAKKAMEEAMKSANEEKVTEELSDSFRETMHATREMYARQVNEASKNLDLLNRIQISEHDRVRFGSIVFTNNQNYFICTGLGELKIDDKSFQTVSTLSPLYQILSDKKKGETFMFLDRLYTVVEVF